MPRELIYTAADEGIDGLRGCLCYAGASNDALSNKLLLQNLLAINNYQELYKAGNPKAHSNPIGFSHYRFNAGVRDCSVLSRIGPAPLYANRTNFIAHHVILDDLDVAKDKAKAGPAWAINNFKFRDHWSPQIGRLDTQRMAIGSLEPQICNYWKSIVGDAGWAGWLAERAQSGKPITVIYPTGLDPLALIQEAIALLPEYQRWNITFSTYYTLGGRGPNCTLRFIPLDADSLAAPFSDKTFHDGVLNLARGLGNAPTGALVNLARGEKPKDKGIPTGLGGTHSPTHIPSFDPFKSNLPGLKPSKDPLFSKSELFIDTKDNGESFDNLNSSGPDNTWKTIAFLAGILGLLFLLVLPPLLTWLITATINNSKVKLAETANSAILKELNALNEKLDTDKKNSDKAIGDLANKLSDKTKKVSETIGELLKVSKVINVENINDLYKKYKEKEKDKSVLVQMPKKLMEDLRDMREKRKNVISLENEKIADEMAFELFIKNNNGMNKILDDGDLILTYLKWYEIDFSTKFANYDKTKKYFVTKAWLDADKLTVDDKKYLDFLKKDYKAKLSGMNDDAFLLPIELLILSNILTLKNPNNLALYAEFEDNLKPLYELLFEEKANYLDEIKFKNYLSGNLNNKKRLSSMFFPKTNQTIKDGKITLAINKSEINQKDWDIFADKFDKYPDKEKVKVGPEDPIQLVKPLKGFTKSQVDSLLSIGVKK
jgi:type II secretory pathway pseudopilin PulG